MKWNPKKMTEIGEALFAIISAFVTIYTVIPPLLINDLYKSMLYVIVAVVAIWIIINKVRNIFSTTWIRCNRFPNQEGNHICYMVERCLSTNKQYEKNRTSPILRSNGHTDIYQEFLDEISLFLERSKHELKMTLPRNPYEQINDPNKKAKLRDTAKNIDKSSIKVKERKKIICLSIGEIDTFKNNLLNDIHNNIAKIKSSRFSFKFKKKIITAFDEYLDIHRNKIAISWHNEGNQTSMEEYIIIDASAYLLCDTSNISIIFSQNEINDKITRFNNIGNLQNTRDFIRENVLKDDLLIKAMFPLEEDYNSVIKYLKKY